MLGTFSHEVFEDLSPVVVPDLAIVSIRISHPITFETLHIIKEKYPQVKIIVSVSMEEKLSTEDLQNRGVSGSLPKTSEVEDIVTAIEAVIAGNDYFK